MAPKVFITGGTGYIGGSVLHTIVTTHPEYEVTALLRNIPETFSSTYPNVKIIKGDYDSSDILADAASQADIVVHNGNSDHENSLKALIAGLIRQPRANPGYLIHLSGTGILSDYLDPTFMGKLNPQVWSDISDLASIQSRPDNAPHRTTEKILNQAVEDHGDKVNIAIVCPPDIYGKGLGLAKTWSAFVPMFIPQIKKLGGRVFYVNEGANTRSWVHINDLMTVYNHLVEAAANGGAGADWGREGYYFASTQEVSHIEIAEKVGNILKKHGVIENTELLQVPLEQVDTMIDFRPIPLISRYLFASNSRSRADRATKLFGYTEKAPKLLDSLEEDILAEIRKS